MENLEAEPEIFGEDSERKKLLKALREFGWYIMFTTAFIYNYGNWYRRKEIISTAFVESTVKRMVSRHTVKNPQMR